MEKLLVTPSPHAKGPDSTRGIMLDVILALCPAAIASVYYFGIRAAITILVCVAACVATEYICRKVMKKDNTIGDLSAVVTGILLAFNLPATISPVIAIIGSVVAIVVVKQMFGGIGQNFANPALTARIILMVSFPSKMTEFVAPFYYKEGVDAVTTATPLGIISEGGDLSTLPSYLDMFIGNRAGCLGETCGAALIIGFIYLLIRRVISPIIPVVYVGTVAVGALIFGSDVLVQVLSGGLLLGAIFMATDYVTSPITLKGKIIFAFGCGFFTILIRQFGSLAEGVSYSILLMNILVPLIEKFTQPKPFGEERMKK